MDDGSKHSNNLEKNTGGESGDILFDDGDVFQPSWIRRAFQDRDGLDKQLLDYGFYFLWRCTIISWIIYFIEIVF
jgi:hypothetical protein